MSEINGHVEPQFQAVADLFAANFDELDEVGASLCVTVEGQKVLDLWGGHREAARKTPWERDTCCVVFSNTKAATAFCAHLLVERGALDLDAPVSRYWPEYGQNGKENTTVLMLLNHTAGLPAVRGDVPPEGFADWDQMVARYAEEAPFWAPGTRTGYHMISFGWLVGEVIRRITGRSLGQYFAEEIAGPLGLDYWIGLPEAEEPRVAPVIFYKMRGGEIPSEFLQKMLAETTSMQALSMLNLGGLNYNSRIAHAAEIGAAGGISNARGLAGLFTPLANDGGDLLSRARVDAMRGLSSGAARDENLLIPTRFGQGFMLNMDNRPAPASEARSFIIPEGAFGHTGAGGSASFADPGKRLAFGYAMNRMGGGFLMNERGQRLIDAVYAAL